MTFRLTSYLFKLPEKTSHAISYPHTGCIKTGQWQNLQPLFFTGTQWLTEGAFLLFLNLNNQ